MLPTDNFNPDHFNKVGEGFLPGLLGMVVTAVSKGSVSAELPVSRGVMAPNGYLHAGSVVTLADSCCGYGCMSNLPEGAQGFTTIELKSNHLGTAREGAISCTATLFHGGRTTQVWDAEVKNKDTGKTIALFRCTQLILYPK
ncbi:PaaI family thioesterase [Proteobacteria bacterium 005FR1]|nr:PaaI family thioesterase [Proteobacteria bacterium 005FR1]